MNELISGESYAAPLDEGKSHAIIWAAGDAFALGVGYTIAFSPDGTQIALGTTAAGSMRTMAEVPGGWRVSQPLEALGGMLAVIDIASGRVLHKIQGQSFRDFNSVAFSPNGRLLASTSGQAGSHYNGKPLPAEVKVLDLAKGEVVRTFIQAPLDTPLHKGQEFWGVAFSPNGRLLATGKNEGQLGNLEGTLKIWEADSGKELHSLKHGDGIASIAFSPNGRWVVTAGFFRLKVWDAFSGAELQLLQGNDVVGFKSLAFSPDGRRLLGGCGDGTVQLWEVSEQGTLTPRTLFKGHKRGVHGVAFAPDGKLLASAGSDQTVKVWDAIGGQELRTIWGHTSGVQAVAFSSGGAFLVSAGGDGVKLWPTIADGEARLLSGHKAGITSLAFSPDGKVLASGTFLDVHEPINRQPPFQYDSQKLWDVATGQELRTLPDRDEIRSVAFRRDGRRLASTGFQKIHVWNMDTARDILTIPVSDNRIGAVAYSPNGEFLASAAHRGDIQLWDAANGNELRVFTKGRPMALSLAFSPDGKLLAGGESHGGHHLWEVDTGREVRTFKSGGAYVAFSPDGKLLATDAGGQAVKVWNVASGQEVQTFTGHTDGVWTVAFSPDGKRLASAGADATIKIWDVVSGQEVRTLKGHTGIVRTVTFSPDGTWLASGGDDKIIRLWDARPLTPEVQVEREALALVRFLFSRSPPKENVLTYLRGDQTINTAVRQQALELAERFH